jgi:hypothetical protein
VKEITHHHECPDCGKFLGQCFLDQCSGHDDRLCSKCQEPPPEDAYEPDDPKRWRP